MKAKEHNELTKSHPVAAAVVKPNPTNLKKTVSEDELYYTKFEIRVKLLMSRTPKSLFLSVTSFHK